MKRLLFLLFVFLNTSLLLIGQNQEIDSLNLLLKTETKDTNKVKLLAELFLLYEYEDEIKARESIQRALTLSKKEKFLKGMAISYTYLGYLDDDLGNYNEALIHYEGALKSYRLLNDSVEIANCYNNIGKIYYAQGIYPEALKQHLSALKIREAIQDQKGVAASYGNIGNVYNDQGNYTLSLKNYFNCLKIMLATDNKKGIATTYNNIALVYTEQNNFNEAIKNHVAALEIRKAMSDKKGIAGSYNNLGLIYFKQNKLDDALSNYNASLEIKNAINDKAGIAGSYCNIGEVYLKKSEFKLANDNLSKSILLSTEIGYRENLRNTYSALAELNNITGNFKSAFENHKLYILYRDSLNNEETREKIIQNQLSYDFEKKGAIAFAEHKKELENQKLLANEKNRKQNLIIFFVAIGLLLVLMFAGIIYRALRITNKQKKIIELQKNYVEQQKLEVEYQKQEVEHQKQLVDEKQKEIIDSITYAKRLQQAILPAELEIKTNFPNSFVFYKPKDIVAGDFYWMHKSKKEDILFIAAADSTGHGVPGAMVSLVCSNALNRAVDEFGLLNTGEILDKTRDLVLETFAKSGEEIKDGMDISLLAINKSTKLIQWSGANNPLWYTSSASVHHFSDKKIIKNEMVAEALEATMHEIKADKQPIGQTDSPKPFTTHIIKPLFPSTFYLITDGYADQFGGKKGKKFKHKQLQELIKSIAPLSINEQYNSLTTTFDNWKGELEQVDDVTILGINLILV